MSCQKCCFDMFHVAQHDDTPRRRSQDTPTPADGVAAIANEPAAYVADENCKNPFREPKQQRDLFKDYFNQLDTLAGQEERI